MAFDLTSAVIGAGISIATTGINSLMPVIAKHISEKRLKKHEFELKQKADKAEADRQQQAAEERALLERRDRANELFGFVERLAQAQTPDHCNIPLDKIRVFFERNPEFLKIPANSAFFRKYCLYETISNLQGFQLIAHASDRRASDMKKLMADAKTDSASLRVPEYGESLDAPGPVRGENETGLGG